MTRLFSVVVLVGALALPISVHGKTPQQALHAHIVQNAKRSDDCFRISTINPYCNHSPVTGSSADATRALRSIREAESLQASCERRNIDACAGQIPVLQALRDLGWCGRGSRGIEGENIVLWAKCSGKPTVINKVN